MAFSRVLRIKPLLNHRLFSTITQPDSAIHKQKIQSALSLLGSKNNNPAEQILYVCLSNTISDLPPPSPSNPIHSFLHELNTQPALMSSFLEELKMQPDFRKERMFSHIITVYGQAGLFLRAKNTFEEMPAMGIDRSVESLNALLGAGIDTGRLLEVNSIFTEYPITYGITRNVDTYNLLLKAWVHYKSKWMVFTALNIMNEEGCKADETTYETVLTGLYEQTPDEAVKVIEFMDERNMFLENIEIYNFGIESLCKLKKLAEAKRLFENMISRGMKPNTITYKHLLGGIEQNVQEVRSLAQDMQEKKVEPDKDASCYKALIKNISLSGDPEAVYQACKDCMKEEWFPSYLSSDPVTLKSLVEKLLGYSRQEEVGELLGRMENLGLQPSVDIYNFVIQKLYQLGDDGKEFFQMVSKRGVKLNVDSYWGVIQALSAAGKTDEMKRLFDDMIEKGVEPDLRICNQLIQDLCYEEKDHTTAFLVCRKCIPMAWFPDFVSTKLATLKNLFEELVYDSLFDEIKELLDTMEKHELNHMSEIYNVTLENLCLIDKGDEAVKIYDRASAMDIKLNEWTYCNLVKLFGENKCGLDCAFEELKKVLADMSKKGVEIGSYCYENIIESICDGKGVETALQVTYDCMPKKWFAQFLSEDTSTIETLVDQLKKESKYEEVWQLLDAMKKNGLQPNLKMFF
ncbi:hypothetical protein ACHQM5_003566 [Ranunculus cassubicifolius]